MICRSFIQLELAASWRTSIEVPLDFPVPIVIVIQTFGPDSYRDSDFFTILHS